MNFVTQKKYYANTVLHMTVSNNSFTTEGGFAISALLASMLALAWLLTNTIVCCVWRKKCKWYVFSSSTLQHNHNNINGVCTIT